MAEKLHTLAYFSPIVASELGGSCHIELGRIFATALHGPYGFMRSDAFCRTLSRSHPKGACFCAGEPMEAATTIAGLLLKQTTFVEAHFTRKAIHERIF
jgi:hypothetical protein